MPFNESGRVHGSPDGWEVRAPSAPFFRSQRLPEAALHIHVSDSGRSGANLAKLCIFGGINGRWGRFATLSSSIRALRILGEKRREEENSNNILRSVSVVGGVRKGFFLIF